MAGVNQTRATPVLCEALRVVRLDDAGAVDVGSNNLIVLRAPVEFQFTPKTEARDTFTQKDGEGNECVRFEGPPNPVTSVDLATKLCQLDAEVLEMLVGGATIADGDDTIGWSAPVQANVNANGVALELWQRAQVGAQRKLLDGLPAHFRHVFPLTRWEVSDQQTLNNGLTIVSIKGVGEQNSAFGTGLADDPLPATIGDTAYEYFLTTDVPDDTAGYAAITGS